jgi:hypothetical protein
MWGRVGRAGGGGQQAFPSNAPDLSSDVAPSLLEPSLLSLGGCCHLPVRWLHEGPPVTYTWWLLAVMVTITS